MPTHQKRYVSDSLICSLISFFMVLLPTATLDAQDILPDKRISINVKNKSIIHILDDITLQSGYFFTYDASLISGTERKDFQVNDLEISTTLDSLLDNDALKYKLIDKNIVIYKGNTIRPEAIESIINHTIIKGKVVAKKNGKPLPYATIGLSDTNLGAISNQTGDFSFKIPLDIKDPLLVVSFMGYKNQYFPVSYPISEPVTINMEQNLISLQEVIIRYQDPVALLSEAIKKIPENYLQDHSRMTAFYRESVSREDHYMVLSEAVLDIAKGPYKTGLGADKVKIFRGRKIVDVSVEDTVLLKLKSGIYASLDLDIIKNPPDFLSEDFTDLYSFEFSDIISFGNKLVYEIRFSPKSHIEETLFTGSIFIDIETLSIVSADFRYDPEKIQREQGMFVVSKSRSIRARPIQTNYHVDYRMLNGYYHISQVRANVDLKVRKRRKWIGSKYSIRIEMAITNVSPGERLKIVSSERVKPNVVMSEETFAYDPDFWGIYNIIEPETSLEEALKLIDKSMQEYLYQDY